MRYKKFEFGDGQIEIWSNDDEDHWSCDYIINDNNPHGLKQEPQKYTYEPYTQWEGPDDITCNKWIEYEEVVLEML